MACQKVTSKIFARTFRANQLQTTCHKSKRPFEEKVVELENLLHTHKGILHKSTVDNIERLQKSTRTLLMRSQDESKLSSMQERISQVIEQIKSAT